MMFNSSPIGGIVRTSNEQQQALSVLLTDFLQLEKRNLLRDEEQSRDEKQSTPPSVTDV